MTRRKVGLWLIGALGNVGSTVALGAAALSRGLCDRTGMVTYLPLFDKLDLDNPAQFVIGGHDVIAGDLASAAARVGGGTPAFPLSTIETCMPELDQWSQQIRMGSNWTDEPNSESVQRIQNDLCDFQRRNELEQIVVVNLASTEPPAGELPGLDEIKQCATGHGQVRLPPSAWYAYAAIAAGFPYVNFTSSCGANFPALIQLANSERVPIAGQDAKTGETLVKTALAPMFAMRSLKVLSWVSHNLLGNNDGRVLNDPANRAGKLKNKDGVVADILGYTPQSHTSIEYVRSLDDWKTAWDFIHFEGFLGVKMSMQFTWQGCDSALAAPLVLDLARLMLLAQRRGEHGIQRQLAIFFKSPMGCQEQDLFQQWTLLAEYTGLAS